MNEYIYEEEANDNDIVVVPPSKPNKVEAISEIESEKKNGDFTKFLKTVSFICFKYYF